jgi:uncharacterized membrane protein YeiB
LAVFGALHYIFLWSGDILFSYSIGAGGLLILLYGAWRPILLAILVLIGIGMLPGLNAVFAIAGSLGFVALISLYLRAERRIKVFRHTVPLFSLVLALIGVVGVIAAALLWVLPDIPKEARISTTVVSPMLLVLAALSAKFHQPVALRELRLGVTIYTIAFLMMTLGGAAQYWKPRESAAPTPGAASVSASDASPGGGEMDITSAKAAAQKALERQVERARQVAKREEQAGSEVRILSTGSYADAVQMRARRFPEKVVGDAGFATVLVAMFLLGSWFVRSGVMENTRAHLALFRKLALYGLPLGIGLGLLGSLIAVTHIPGDEHDGFLMARGLAMLGNLPACLGYVGLVVLMLNSQSGLARIGVLAPLGRMALTTYLTQSVLCSLYFYGYGLGHWGMARSWQLLFVVLVLTLQLAFSHWWLARYRFGPVEWLWRAFTYRQSPAMRR